MQDHHNVADRHYMWICVCWLNHRHAETSDFDQSRISDDLQTDGESDLQT